MEDLTGQKFGRLTVIKRVENSKDNKARWLCKCDCGHETIVRAYYLKNGNTKSCGCIKKEFIKGLNLKHNLCNTRLYKIFETIKTRCYNKNRENYKYYGGRGIKICDEWLNDFMNFYDWSINNGYQESLTIDRINVNGNYEPNNCRWITFKKQCRNRRSNNNITYNNKTHCLAEWAEITGIKASTIYRRIKYYNWSVEKALTTK